MIDGDEQPRGRYLSPSDGRQTNATYHISFLSSYLIILSEKLTFIHVMATERAK